MSDSTATATPAGGAPKVMKIEEAVIRIAGNSQDGNPGHRRLLAVWPGAASRKSDLHDHSLDDFGGHRSSRSASVRAKS